VSFGVDWTIRLGSICTHGGATGIIQPAVMECKLVLLFEIFVFNYFNNGSGDKFIDTKSVFVSVFCLIGLVISSHLLTFFLEIQNEHRDLYMYEYSHL
jgi:hypothetical protein